EVIKGLIAHPMGGRETDISLSYAHNLWFDVAYDAGVVPFILLLFFSLLSYLSLVKLSLLDHPSFIKVLFICIYTGFFVIFMTEPIMASTERFYFVIFCLISGITQG